MTSRTSRDLADVNNIFAVTPETGIVYVSRPEALDELQDENITVSLFILVNVTHDEDDDNYDDDYEAEWVGQIVHTQSSYTYVEWATSRCSLLQRTGHGR